MSERAYGSRYLDWVKHRPPVRYNLARSGLPRPSLDSLALTLEDVTAADSFDEGWAPYLACIAGRYGVTPDRVVTTVACALANHLVFAALVEPGDDVVIETPGYEPLVRLAEYRGARVVPLRRREENAWRVDPEDARRVLTPRTRLAVFSDLNNPTGAHDTDDALRDVAKAAAAVGAHVLVDEIYLEFFKGRKSAAVLADNIVATSSLTKVFGLDSLRSGWILASPDLARRIWRLNGLFSNGSPQPSERIALRALERADDLLAPTRAWLLENLEAVDAFIRRQPRLSWCRPPAGTIGFVRLEGGDTAGLAERLQVDHGVGIVPGHFFGVPGYFRLGWSLETEGLKAALFEFDRALQKLP